MLTITKVDTNNKTQVRKFVQFPYKHYQDCPFWVPPLFIDANLFLDRKKHPFFEHSDADFFIAELDGQVVGRIGVLENRAFNLYHHTSEAQFYFFESIDSQAVANALFEPAFDWARARGLTRIVGPKGMGPLDGYGVLVEGYQHRQMMTMMNYNYAYYPRLIENLGFEKEVDFVSCYIPAENFSIPERVERIAKRVLDRGKLQVKRFKSKRELIQWSWRIGQAYNAAFVNNWEYFPFTEREIKFVVDNIVNIADHRLIKIIVRDEQPIGFLFAFPDLSAALQRARGKLFPFGLPDLLLEMRRTKTVAGNGMGILPEFQGHGGNALLYCEMANSFMEFEFQHVEMTQIAETATQMRADLKNLMGVEYKNHRVYHKTLD